MRRGEIWWASLPEPAGSQPGFRRPVLIVQSNDFNQSRIRAFMTEQVSQLPARLMQKVDAGLRQVLAL
jgi:mRNA interferase MazF